MACFIISEEVKPGPSRWTLQIHRCCFKIPCHHGLGLISLGRGIFSLGAQPSLLHHMNPCLVPNRGKSPYIMTQTCFTFWGVDDFERWKEKAARALRLLYPNTNSSVFKMKLLLPDMNDDKWVNTWSWNLGPTAQKLARYCCLQNWWRSYGHGPT